MGKAFHANKTGADQDQTYMKRFHTTTKRFYQHYFRQFSN